MENNELIAQSNRLIQAKYSETLSFWESFIFAKTCSLIQKEETDFNEYKLYLKEMLDYVDVPASGEAYKLIYEASQKLLDRRISFTAFNKEGKKEIIDTHLVMSVSRLAQPEKGENLYFKVLLHPSLKPYLLQLKTDFSQFQLADYKALRTHTAIRIYEILKSWYGRKKTEVTFEVEELKEMLGLKGKYGHFGGFKKKVLDEAQRRMRENMDLSFEYFIIKKGREAHSVLFKISQNKPKVAKKKVENEVRPVEVEETKNEAHEKLFEELHPTAKGWGVGVSAFMKLIEGNTEEKIRAGIRMTKEAEKVGKVQNLAGYFTQAVREGYSTPTEAKAKKQVEAKAKIEAEKAKEQAEQAKADQAKKEKFERDRKAFLSMVEAKPEIILEIVEAMKNHTSPLRQKAGNEYQTEKTFAENWEAGGRSLQMALEATAKELYPAKFGK